MSDTTHYHNSLLQYNTRYVIAPMINLSDFSYIQLCHTYNATYSYTQMYWLNDMMDHNNNKTDYFDNVFDSYPINNVDIPIAIQVGGNNIDLMVHCIQLINQCNNNRFVAIDINLGCPLRHARTHLYGAYQCETIAQRLQTCNLIHSINKCSILPITCKVRLLNNIDDTLQFYVSLIQSGCQLLCIHARYIDYNKSVIQRRYGTADLDTLRYITRQLKQYQDIRVRQCIVIGNGNVQCYDDVINNISYTSVDGYMCAESILNNPAIYTNTHIDAIQLCQQYINLVVANNVTLTPTSINTIITHIRHMLSVDKQSYSNNLLYHLELCQSIDDIQQLVSNISNNTNYYTTFDRSSMTYNDIHKLKHKQLRQQSGQFNSKERNQRKRKLAKQEQYKRLHNSQDV